MYTHVVEYLEADQFREVAAYYGWKNFQDHSLDKRGDDTHCIYFYNGKPDGWDQDGKSSTKEGLKRVSYNEWRISVGKEPIKTNEVNKIEYIIECSNSAQAKAFIKFHMYQSINDEDIDRTYKKGLGFRMKGTTIQSHSNMDYYENKGYTLVPFETWALINGVVVREPKVLKLTNDYSAIVDLDAKTVVVGCQTIPFDKVEELYELTINK